MQSDFGLIGLGVMGQNLARNVSSKGFRTSVYNRTASVTDAFIAAHGGDLLVGHKTMKAFVRSLRGPKKILIMVKAGPAVDAVIKELLPHLKKGDVVLDGGNSNYRDTQRRYEMLKKKGIHFVGCGVSGGEEGALNGPSLMPGGSKQAWTRIKKILTAIAAKDFAGDPCVAHIGDDGAGHYVKMAHNGIEYAVMQLMAETYAIYRTVYNLPATKIADRFEKMNNGKLQSFLFESAIPVLRKKDEKDGQCCLIYNILDKASQKGTGKWASQDALDRGVAVPTITQAVYARFVSAEKKERVNLEKLYPHSHKKPMALARFDRLVEDALYGAILSSYAQGYDLMQKAAEEETWQIDLAEVSRIWEGGCIIRATLLNTLHKAYAETKDRPARQSPGGSRRLAGGSRHMFAVPAVVPLMKKHIPALRKLVAASVSSGINLSGFSSALYYFESMTEQRLPANFIQGLRDYFGAHTYERTDDKGSFHTKW